MVLKLAYTIFIGILLSLFVGVGIAAFYPQPQYPEYPSFLNKPYQVEPNSTESAQLEKEQKAFDEKTKAFQKENETYNKNVSMISLGASVLYLLLGLLLVTRLRIISDGLLLGGVLTLMYSIVRGFGANDDIFRFLVVTAGLVIALILGYVKFVKGERMPSSK